ncbi:hypothetical protein JK386_06705 [Nocardioides sp. zg-536]|uniref:Uncharacterized protein n=1 Tax=Nocardioides faecalis TaxID=2803858 RepID=A0A938XZX3_9ACTN|nr:hypothetical protein [Nocardioides faecalis]MBM9459587.1 hypothetical protein [Nocardioides faecalis]QVI58113.1 hypothetical protein KG111_14000 [Nocardioides faecalis]
MTGSDDLRSMLATGRFRAVAEALVGLEAARRRRLCRPLVGQARAVLDASLESTVATWLADLREGYPGGRERFVGAWRGRLGTQHWDAATTVLLGARTTAQAAKVWPVPEDSDFTVWLYPALFGDELAVVTEQWAADFATNPKHWDRNRGREVMFEWVEAGLVPAPSHDGAVLMLLDGWAPDGGREQLGWLLEHPVVTEQVFRRIFTTPGIKGASTAQADSQNDGEPLRNVVIPGLVAAGVWDRELVRAGAQTALASTWPAYQRRWFARLADDFAD